MTFDQRQAGDYRVQCPVEDRVLAEPTRKEINAFRVVPEAGDAFFLDFIHYCPTTKRGEVVERLRMHLGALEAVRSRLSTDVIEIRDTSISVVWPSPDPMEN